MCAAACTTSSALMLPDKAGVIQTSGGHKRVEKIPLLMTGGKKSFQPSMMMMTLAGPPTAASLLLSCSSMPSPPPTGTPSNYLSTCSLSLSLSLNCFPLPSYTAVQVPIVTCCYHSHRCLLLLPLPSVPPECPDMCHNALRHGCFYGNEKGRVKGSLVQWFEHDDGSSSSQHAVPLLSLSHGYLQRQDNNKVLEMYAKCVASPHAHKMFDNMPNRNIDLLHILINGTT
jgi:hypothetical protein